MLTSEDIAEAIRLRRHPTSSCGVERDSRPTHRAGRCSDARPPPAEHILSDLDLEVEVRPDCHRLGLASRCRRHLLASNGGVHAAEYWPSWSTSSGEPLPPGGLPRPDATAEPPAAACSDRRPARSGGPGFGWCEGTDHIGLEVVLLDGPGDRPDPARPNAWATMNLRRTARTDAPRSCRPCRALPNAPRSFGIAVAIGPRGDRYREDPARGRRGPPVGDYVSNTFGALQGGVMALLGRLPAAQPIDERWVSAGRRPRWTCTWPIWPWAG